MARTQRAYIRSNAIQWRSLVDSVGYNIKILSDMTGQSERQVRRNLKKLERGEEIGKRGYGKRTSLSPEDSYKFMCMKYLNKSKTEIEEALSLSDSKYRRIEKLVVIPQCVFEAKNAVAVKLSSRYTNFFVIWDLGDGNLKTTFETDFKGNRINDIGLCFKLIDIISNGYEISCKKSVSFFDEIEGRKVERCENQQEVLNYYLHYFISLKSKFERIEEIRKYFGSVESNLPSPFSDDSDKFNTASSSSSDGEDNLLSPFSDDSEDNLPSQFSDNDSDEFSTDSSLSDSEDSISSDNDFEKLFHNIDNQLTPEFDDIWLDDDYHPLNNMYR